MSQSPLEDKIIELESNNNNPSIMNKNNSFHCDGVTHTSINIVTSQTSPPTISRFKCDEIPGNKIFVGGLSWDTTQEKLYEYFSGYGSIIDCILMLDGTTGRSRGFGFVTFLHQEAVKDVLAVKQHILDNKVIDPKEAVPKYIKDIENRMINSSQSNCHTSNVTTTANNSSNYGCTTNNCSGAVVSGGNSAISVAVATSKISNSHHTTTTTTGGGGGNGNGNGSSAKAASIKVSHSRRSSCVIGEQLSTNNNTSNCQHNPSSCFLCPNVLHNTKVFVGGIGHASEADLREYFSTFGTVVDVNIMMDKTTGRPRGFAFIGFSTNEAADLTASMRYHCVRNKQVEVKKALPKDTKFLSTPNNNLSHNSTAAAMAVSENHHPIVSNCHLNSNTIPPTPHKNNTLKNYNVPLPNCEYSQVYSRNHPHPHQANTSFDESFISSHDQQHTTSMSTVVTPVDTTANCSLMSGGGSNTTGRGGGVIDDRASVLLSTAYNGEWDFDEVIHFVDPQSSMMYSANNNTIISGTNSPPRVATTTSAGGVLMDNTTHSNLPTTHHHHHSIQNLMNEPIHSSTVLRHRDSALFAMTNNKPPHSQMGTSLFNLEQHTSNTNAPNTYNPASTNTAVAGVGAAVGGSLQPMRFNSVGDTTSLLNRQIPDDTKNSIVELLNEIWKGTG